MTSALEADGVDAPPLRTLPQLNPQYDGDDEGGGDDDGEVCSDDSRTDDGGGDSYDSAADYHDLAEPLLLMTKADFQADGSSAGRPRHANTGWWGLQRGWVVAIAAVAALAFIAVTAINHRGNGFFISFAIGCHCFCQLRPLRPTMFAWAHPPWRRACQRGYSGRTIAQR